MIGLGVAIIVSGMYEPKDQNGLHLIRSPDEYQTVEKKAFDIYSPIMSTTAFRGGALSAGDMEKLRTATPLFEELCVFEPKKIGPYVALGEIHYLLGEIPEAERSFRQAIDVAPLTGNDPKYAQLGVAAAQSGLAKSYLEDHDYRQALASANDSIKTEPNVPLYYFQRARVCIQLQMVKEAEADLKYAIKLQPDNAEFVRLLRFVEGAAKK